MKNINLLSKMVQKGFTQTSLAKKLGLSLQGFNAKVNGRSQFNILEVKTLIELLDIKDEEIKEIFLS